MNAAVNEPGLPPYIAVYRITTKDPQGRHFVLEDQVGLEITPGPLSFRYSVPLKSYGPRSTSTTIGERQVELPRDSYIVLSIISQSHDGFERERMPLSIAEAASLIALRFPQLLDEKLFEGFVNSEGHAVIWPEGPMSLTASPNVDLDTVAKSFLDDISSMQRLDPQTRDRVQLAARWFRRGHEAQNSVDKFLYWWITLEICLVAGTNKTVKHVQRMLRDEVYPNVCVQELEKHLLIKRIYRKRNEIVHRGIAFADDEDRDFRGYLRRLRAIATVSLRLLCGQAPGDDLEEFIKDNQSS